MRRRPCVLRFRGPNEGCGLLHSARTTERAYELLQDPDVLAKCIPGCEGLDRTAEDEYSMSMKLGIASISGRFDGKVRISEQNPSVSFRMSVEGSGKIGFMKGDGVITLKASDAGSMVEFEGDVQVGGTVANVGQRLTETTAKMIIKRFFDCLAQSASPAGR
jgi:carbon monoxide dehydrogenase subunit G